MDSLQEILRSMDIKKLEKDKGRHVIGCPFCPPYSSRVTCSPRISSCFYTCAQMFPKIRRKGSVGKVCVSCPCLIMNKSYVRRKFWRELYKAQLPDNQTKGIK